jgi:predicted phage-related endonuclease
MHISENAQGTDEWMVERTGIVTGSNFNSIFTSAGKKSASAEGYRNQLLAEWVTGTKTSIKATEWMQRGVELEPRAKLAYEIITGHSVTEVGLCRDSKDSLIGVSPDGLVEDMNAYSHGLEIKCPMPANHIKYISDRKLPTTYVQQVQGSMLITGIDKWDFMSYHPAMPHFLITVEKDQKYHNLIKPILDDFIGEMLKKREFLSDFIND